ncbi:MULTISPECIES: EF-hand domain-containing protein [Rhizobium]|uniref:Ca2+-binding EF-hand superfamily protein n=1 Tax=Rhizobium esperanzae TaxID=1967781 RepID=A0A7W6URN8_9HYPH|nr:MULTISPECIES: EF-hand domain-containing protein [Rhizobium]MBB4443028.1 Ca2+-binding EF-hand superfamily protein [Rhizobium esperanzae]MDH6205799.1 Ca2+-binding EF-hand superfamily protein [Rhizobium leguminosarum]
MTTISAATSVSSYSYSKHSTSASEEILSSNTVSSAKATKSGQLDEDTSSSADKLLSQLMTLSMNRFSDQSVSGEDEDGGEGTDVAQLDSDGDGYVSKAEFVAARPSEVTEDQANTLFNSFDSESTGSLSVDALTEAMSAEQSQRPGGPPPPAGGDDLASLLSDLDTDGDGSISKDEFVAGRPSDVTEDQAGTLFDSFDSEGAGSLSVDALTEAMSAEQSQRSEGPPPPPPAEDDQSQSLLSDLDTNGDGLVTLDEFMAGKPEDVTESQASQLFSLLDTSDTGSLSLQSVG